RSTLEDTVQRLDHGPRALRRAPSMAARSARPRTRDPLRPVGGPPPGGRYEPDGIPVGKGPRVRARLPRAVVKEVVAVREAPPSAEVIPVEASGVRRRFRDVVALDGASIRIPSRSIHALLGPNGAGKTTLIRVLTGLVEPDAGQGRIMGIPLTGVTSR